MKYLSLALVIIAMMVLDFMSDLWLTSAHMRHGWDESTSWVILVGGILLYLAIRDEQ